jgi:glycine/D-amino acid oxidase-like deaminating enzyme
VSNEPKKKVHNNSQSFLFYSELRFGIQNAYTLNPSHFYHCLHFTATAHDFRKMVLRKVVVPHQEHSHNRHTATHHSEDHSPSQSQQLLPVPNPLPSYWLKSPHRYAKLRSTPSLPPKCDIAIIGSGMSGILTAYHILQQSHSSAGQPLCIVILEARELCSGATARNGGHAKVKTATLTGMKDKEMRTQFQEYVHDNIKELKRVVDTEGLECEFEMRRSFDVFQDPIEYGEVKSIYKEALQQGEQWTSRISLVPEEYVQQITSIKHAVGAFSVETASFSPYKLCTQLLEILINRYPDRINVQTLTPVTRLSTSGPNSTILYTSSRGTLLASKTVYATNAYTSGLLPSFQHTIIPYKGMNSHHVPLTKPIYPHLNQTYNIHFAPDVHGRATGVDYLNPRPDGGIVVGGGKWFYADPSSPSKEHSWWNNIDDSESGRFPPEVEEHWMKYMQDTFLGWYVCLFPLSLSSTFPYT